jgi:S-DNA-T family DNA segregation ATPase FtsK/SpoIIIE
VIRLRLALLLAAVRLFVALTLYAPTARFAARTVARVGEAAQGVRTGLRAGIAWWRQGPARSAVWRALSRTVRLLLRLAGRLLAYTARILGRVLAAAGRELWRWALPYLTDAWGWLRRRARRAPAALARAFGRVLVWSVYGFGWCTVHAARYLSGHEDYAARLAAAKDDHDHERAVQLRQEWRDTAKHRLGRAALLGVGGLVVLVGAIAAYGAPVVLLVIVTGVTVLAAIGRRARRDAGIGPDAVSDPEGPYPIADARTRGEAADCLRRSLVAHGIDVREIEDPHRTRWGWEIPIVLRRGTPAQVVAKAGDLETTLDLPANGVLCQPDRSRRARIVMRLAILDPFANLGEPPYRTPRELSITDRHVVARCINGEDLKVSLYGVHAVVIGVPGAGKSQTLRAIAETVTACRDAIVWDLDPSGNGLDALGDAIGRRERDPAGIEAALTDALALAEVRPRMLGELGMSSSWKPTPERPAVVVIIDEYPRLTPEAKQLAVNILRVGRKSCVTLILAASEATSDTLGDAIADITALRFMLACRHTDIRLVLGPQMAADGWRPDRLHPATGDSPEDGGCVYVYGAGAREPLLSKMYDLSDEEAAQRGADRAAIGIPRVDDLSWRQARARQALSAARHRNQVDAVADILAVFDSDDRLWTDEILSRLAEADPGRYGDWTADDLSAALRPYGVRSVQIRAGDRNRHGYHRQIIADAWRQHRPDQP